MFYNNGKGGKKAIISVLIATLMFTSACQPTPESNIVISKNDGTLEAALDTENEYDPMAIVYPEHWKAEYEQLGGRLKVDIDADVIAKHKAYNVVKIEPYLVPIDQANKIIKGLFGTTDVYNYDLHVFNKSQIESLIVKLRANKVEAVTKGDEEYASYLEETINDFSILHETAPEATNATSYDHKFTDTSEYDTVRESILVKRDIYDFSEPYLSIDNTMKDRLIECPESRIIYLNNFSPNLSLNKYKSETSILGQGFEKEAFVTEEAKAAIAKANAFLGEICAEDRVLQHIKAYTMNEGSDMIVGYSMDYGIRYDGTVMTAGVHVGSFQELMGEDYTGHEPYAYEDLCVDVENGEIVGFQWTNIFDTGAIIKENVALMPLEEIMKNIDNQLTAKYAYLETFGESESIYVDQIILTYAVEAVKDKPGEYMLIPAWAFYGGVDYGDGYELIDGTILKGKHAYGVSLLTINAVDGSVVHLH